MKKILALTLLSSLLLGCNLFPQEENSSSPSLADAAIFSLPQSMTTSTSRAISQGSKDMVGGFYNYAKDQVKFADECSLFVKNMIKELEQSGVFGLDQDAVVEDGAQNRFRWTINTQTQNAYTFEWWMKNGANYKKMLELQLNQYERTQSAVQAEGYTIFYPGADPDIATNWPGAPQWLRVDFDSQDADGNQYLKIQMQDFMAESLDGTAAQTQNGILEAWKDTTGSVLVQSVVRVPGMRDLNYEIKNDTGAPSETRYYVFTGTGNGSSSTVNLAMPYTGYSNATVFDSDLTNPQTVGDVIAEYVADDLRADGTDFGGHATLNNLVDLSIASWTRDAYNATTPSTTEIVDAIESAYQSYPETAGLEDLVYLMTVANPAYFTTTGFDSFGSTAPAGFPETADLPTLDITQSEVDNFDNTSLSFDSPGDTPPSPTL